MTDPEVKRLTELAEVADERDVLRASLAAIAEIVHFFAGDDGADPIVGKVQELLDCYRDVERESNTYRDAFAKVRARLNAITTREPTAEELRWIRIVTGGTNELDAWRYVRDALLAEPVTAPEPAPEPPVLRGRIVEDSTAPPVRFANDDGGDGPAPTLESDLEHMLNRHCAENPSNTPDWILSQFLIGCLTAWNTAVQQRETWYGRDARPGHLHGINAEPVTAQESGEEGRRGEDARTTASELARTAAAADQRAPAPAPTDVLDAAEEMLRRIAATACLDLDPIEAAAIVAELDRLRALVGEQP